MARTCPGGTAKSTLAYRKASFNPNHEPRAKEATVNQKGKPSSGPSTPSTRYAGATQIGNTYFLEQPSTGLQELRSDPRSTGGCQRAETINLIGDLAPSDASGLTMGIDRASPIYSRANKSAM
jgi:hypothetical protein